MTANPISPWLAPFVQSEGELRRLATFKPDPLVGLERLPIGIAADRLGAAMKDAFHPTKNIIMLLEEILVLGQCHADRTYSDGPSFVKGAHEKESPLGTEGPLVLLTGLAGSGKSALLAALARVLGARRQLKVHGLGVVPFVANWNFRIGERTAISKVLGSLMQLAEDAAQDSLGVPIERRMPILPPKDLSELVENLRARAFRDGVSLLTADEFQFFTRSSGANALVTSLLFRFLSIGVPCVWTANYGLGHRLLKRPHEDFDRLFAREPLILLPDDPDSADWWQTIEAMLAVAPNVFDLDVRRYAEELHEMTAGLKRYLRFLLVEAYKIARTRNGPADIEYVRTAYKWKFGSIRKIVEYLRQIDRGVVTTKIRRDLVCPFPLPDELLERRKGTATESRVKEAFKKLAYSQITQDERAAYEAIKLAAKNYKVSSSVTDIKEAKPSRTLSVENLLRAEADRVKD